MTTAIIMPKFEMSQETGTIARWLKAEGDVIVKGEAILEVETDKVTMEVESPANGVLRGITAEAGAVIPIGQVIARIESETDAAALASAAKIPTPRATPIAEKMAAEHGLDLTRVTGSGKDGQITRTDVEGALAATSAQTVDKINAAPAARRVAREQGLDLTDINGSGPGGRIQL